MASQRDTTVSSRIKHAVRSLHARLARNALCATIMLRIHVLQCPVPLGRGPIRGTCQCMFNVASTKIGQRQAAMGQVTTVFKACTVKDSVPTSWDTNPSKPPRCALIGYLSRYLFLRPSPGFLLQVPPTPPCTSVVAMKKLSKRCSERSFTISLLLTPETSTIALR